MFAKFAPFFNRQLGWQVQREQRPQECHHALHPEPSPRVPVQRRQLPVAVVSQDEASRVPHQAVQEKVQRRLSHLQAAHRAVLLPRQDVPGGQVSCALLPEHQAEVAPAADAAEAAERGHDEAANGADERVEGEHQQLRGGKRPSEEHRQLLDSSNATATAATTTAATSAAAATAAADDEPAHAATAAASPDADATRTASHEPRNDEPLRKARVATNTRCSCGRSEGPRGSPETIQPAAAGASSRLRRQGQLTNDDVASTANGQCPYGSAGAPHDGRPTAAVAATTAATAAATEVPTQSHAAATDANGSTWSTPAAAAATATTTRASATAGTTRPAPAA